MARSWQQWQHSRWRSVVAQAVMWVILGGTVAVAALVSHRPARRVELGPPVKHDQLLIAVPKGWVAEMRPESQGAGTRAITSAKVLVAYPPADDDGESLATSRVITVTQETTVGGVTPEQYLTEWKRLSRPYRPFRLAGRPGVRTLVRQPIQVSETQVKPGFGFWGCTVLPSGLAVTVQVKGLGEPRPGDERLFNQVAEALQIVE